MFGEIMNFGRRFAVPKMYHTLLNAAQSFWAPPEPDQHDMSAVGHEYFVGGLKQANNARSFLP